MRMATAETLAREDAETAVEIARTGASPVEWICSGFMGPTLREFEQAERVWQADYELEDPVLFEAYVEIFERELDRANVAISYDADAGGAYVTDLARWEFCDDPDGAETLEQMFTPIAREEA